ncbi:MAG: hypothetical protein U9O85_04080 [Euryarchaeota archaeon]|nr:hypothetical protein [Euryarchaeota archaeon]
MPKNEKHTEIFIVVMVHSGIPAIAEAFLDENAADKYADELKEDIRPEYDEVEVFQTTLR